ncbi:hypothetical protein ACRALDRAFT_2029173 [Sodiomyces alcalophilus JCM 7366]|uniref:uncharacterized protein n=1 Tax=Sodiomyces alcalophilus JCM 7366 TaxID=591952 RepID=UPI0039B4DC75
MSSNPGRIMLPGFGLPLKSIPSDDKAGPLPVFPSPLLGTWQASTLTIRELYMLWFVEQITNKPDWHIKVFNDEIVSKWKDEIANVDWISAVGYEHGPFSDAMFDYSIVELRDKARLYEKVGFVPVFDVSAAVIKSDSAIPPELKDQLRAAVASLEDVPDHEKDWHPGSDGKVLDLVHPSLWPLVYGRSRILPNERLTLDNCLDACGIGQVIPNPTDRKPNAAPRRATYRPSSPPVWSERFQWLPCDVDLDDAGRAKIVSYINNLHPTRHRDLYSVIEKVIDKTLPLWDMVHRWPREFGHSLDKRIQCNDISRLCTVPDLCRDAGECEPYNRPLDEGEEPRPDLDDYWELDDEDPPKDKDDAWFDQTHPVRQPEPIPHQIPRPTAESIRKEREGGSTFSFFNGVRRLQVIVKLANIHLTPENPTYDGGSWHVEGQLNEHICATALYYYDNHNITPSHLAFRTQADREGLSVALPYEQNVFRPITLTFAIDDAQGSTVQNLGRVLTREDRLLAFPNVYQHRVAPFSLADKSRPGHRKILALFLVDPAIPIISTANVPPQQRHWWLQRVEGHADPETDALPAKLPPELRQIVLDQMDFPIGWEEAKATRLELMDERSSFVESMGSLDDSWNFCEH